MVSNLAVSNNGEFLAFGYRDGFFKKKHIHYLYSIYFKFLFYLKRKDYLLGFSRLLNFKYH